ncbi:MAG: CinA family protein [Paracoccaceae bacterium]
MASPEHVLDLAREHGVKISTAESCTGGMVMAALTDIAGSSAVVDRGFITYSNEAKQDMLDVRLETLETYGAVSEDVASEMASGALSHSLAQLAVSVTGIAGPGGSEFKPEGRVCFGIADTNGTRTVTKEFGALGRAQVRECAKDYALDLLQDALSKLSTT